MFNNVIYLIVVLLIFNVAFPETRVEEPLWTTVLMHLAGWGLFFLYCRRGFQGLVRDGLGTAGWNGLAARYQGMVTRMSILAVFLFALNVHFFHLPYWLHRVPGAGTFSVIPGLLAVGVFFVYLATVWFCAHPAYGLAHGTDEGRGDFIRGNLRLNLPILFPWVCLTLLYDILGLTPWAEPGRFLDTTEGHMAFFAAFLMVLMTFMPRLIQSWWGCTPLPRTAKVLALEDFLERQGFQYRGLLRWPLFQGRTATAGIMGIVPRYRYILVTDALLELLPVEELQAVMAHEMGHAKYRHLLFYVLFFLGFMVVLSGFSDVVFYLIASRPFFAEALESGLAVGGRLFYVAMAVPLLIAMVVYFRFVMGFFMRHFERQADLFAAETMGGPGPVIRSLERIGMASGNIRDLPSWHHFSIRERVECLEKAALDRGVVRRHHRFLAVCFGLYLAGILGAGWFLHYSDTVGKTQENMEYGLLLRVLERRIEKEPENPQLLSSLAMLHHHLGRHAEAVRAYERSLSVRPRDAAALNNLAWILATVPDEDLRDPPRAVDLARKAVALERNAPFLDTLAEAFFANGLTGEAVKAIDEAIALAEDRRDYYLAQRERFLSGRAGPEGGPGNGPP